MKDNFKEFDFSGDVGLEIRGSTRADVLANAARGLFGLVVSGDVTPACERVIRVTSDSDENLLVDWLSEIITTAATFGEVYAEVEVIEKEPGRVEGILRGEPIDEHRHRLRFDVKAATYHKLEFRRDREGYFARVIFDL